jgi:hypothetical protein
MSNTYGAGIIGLQITPAMYQYLVSLLEYGIQEGQIGNQSLNPAVVPLLDAIHNILAGGTATVQITTPGNPQVVAELKNGFKDANDAANEINKKLGFYLTAVA